MQGQFIHDGKAVDFTPSADVGAGSIVVQGDLVGITKRDIRPAHSARSLWKASLIFPKTQLWLSSSKRAQKSTSTKTELLVLTMSAPRISVKSLPTQPQLILSSEFA